MTGRSKRAKRCRGCGVETDALSRRGYCRQCSIDRAIASVEQMWERRGAVYERWRAGVHQFFEVIRPAPGGDEEKKRR